MRLHDLRNLDFARGKLSYRCRRRRKLCKILTFPLHWGDLLEEEIATHSSILAWRILWTEEPNRLQSMGSQRVVPGSTPSGSRSTQGMSGIIKEGHTQKVAWKKRFFIFRIAQFL